MFNVHSYKWAKIKIFFVKLFFDNNLRYSYFVELNS